MIDLYLFDLIYGFAGKWAWLDFAGIFFAARFEYILWLILLGFLIINFKKSWRMVAEAFSAAAVARFVLAEIVRFIWFRPRPFVALDFIPLINKSAEEPSFPSGHASFYFALSTIVYFYNKKAGIWFSIASFFIVLSRVFVGVHWPSDILAGALLGIATAWLLHKLFKKYEDRIFGSRGSVRRESPQ